MVPRGGLAALPGGTQSPFAVPTDRPYDRPAMPFVATGLVPY
jgi:hypothetical protein